MTVAEVRRKVIGVPLEKAATQEDGTFVVLGRFTSDQKDEVGDIITRSATERALPKYKRWGNIRLMHQPIPVGRVTRIGVEDGLEWNEVEIKVIDPQARFMVENGLLQALSVGILVNFADVEMLQDGGWVINDYQLAEISLVDHPANYDAALETLHLSLDAALRDKIREQGVVPVLRSIGVFPAQKGELMEENTTPVEPVAEEVERHGVDEQPVAEAQAEEAAAVVEESPVAEAAPAAEEVPAEESVTAEAPVAEEQNPIAVAFQQLSLAIATLTEKVDGLVAQKEDPAPKAGAESAASDSEAVGSQSEPQAKGIGGEDDRVAQLEKTVADLTAQVAALSTPVERKGALPVEDAAGEEAAVDEQPEAVQKPKSLNEALSLYMKGRSARR